LTHTPVPRLYTDELPRDVREILGKMLVQQVDKKTRKARTKAYIAAQRSAFGDRMQVANRDDPDIIEMQPWAVYRESKIRRTQAKVDRKEEQLANANALRKRIVKGPRAGWKKLARPVTKEVKLLSRKK